MKRFLSFSFFLVAFVSMAWAQKTVYIPNEWRNPWPSDSLLYKESDPECKYTWSKTRSAESDNVIVFWDKNYGNKKPNELAESDWNYVDIPDLLNKCEAFYDLEINKLGFVDSQMSNHSKYKMMVLMNYSKPGDWACYGGGYDYVISALWLNSATCKPVGHSVAHEVGHSFHYMCYAEHSGHKESDSDNTGFHLACGNGQAIWEQTAQWQANQSYPTEMFNQSINVFRKSHNYAFSHEWHRYQSYWFHYYLCQYYNDITTVAQVWNQPMTGQSRGNATDFNQALMKLKGLDAKALFRLYYDYAARCATWDMDVCKPYRNSFIGDFEYRCVALGDTAWQVALASAPQASGFNIIPLEVPADGTTITTHFTALPASSKLASGDPAEMLNGETQWAKTNRTTYVRPSNAAKRGFRLGYVALLNNGTREYYQQDSIYCEGNAELTADVNMTVPQNTKKLWLVVVPAPTTYLQHKWDEKINNDDQWPYRFSLEGTDLAANATVYVDPTLDGRPVSDVTLTYDVYFPYSSTDYAGTSLTVSGRAAAMLGTALQMNSDEIGSKMQDYAASGPSEGKVMFYPCNPKTGDIVKRGSTANGYGHWFNASGTVCEYGSGYVYSELTPSSLTFNLGQYPGRGKNGNDYTISQALVYKKSSTEKATARFVFRIHMDADKRAAELASIDYNDPTGIKTITTEGQKSQTNGIYNMSGQRVDSPSHGIYIINGKKIKL